MISRSNYKNLFVPLSTAMSHTNDSPTGSPRLCLTAPLAMTAETVNSWYKKIGLLMAIGTIFLAAANERQETFLKAADLYDQGDIASALSLYQSITEKSPAILYNIGSCCYLLGNYPQALSAFRSAQQNADSNLMKKLDSAIEQVKTKLNLPNDSSWYRSFLIFESYFSVFMLQVLFLLCLLLLVIAWWLRFSWTLKLGGLLLITAFLGSFCCIDYWLASQEYVIALQKDIPVFTGPNESFHTILLLPAGAEIKVVEEQQSWYKVYGNGAYGWVEKRHLESLK